MNARTWFSNVMPAVCFSSGKKSPIGRFSTSVRKPAATPEPTTRVADAARVQVRVDPPQHVAVPSVAGVKEGLERASGDHVETVNERLTWQSAPYDFGPDSLATVT